MKDDKLDLINTAIDNTKYIMAEKIMYKNIKKVFIKWLCAFILSTVIINCIQYISLDYTGKLGNSYYTFNNIVVIALYSLCYLYYLLMTKEVDVIKERRFLNLFSIIVFLLSFLKIIFPLSTYLNASFMIDLYSSFPLELLITIIGICMIYNYFKTNPLKLLLIILIGIAIVMLIVKIIVYQQYEGLAIHITITSILLDYINTNSIITIIAFLSAYTQMKSGD